MTSPRSGGDEYHPLRSNVFGAEDGAPRPLLGVEPHGIMAGDPAASPASKPEGQPSVTSSGPSVRLDKWLQVARAYKTRTQATRACTLGRVQVNGERAKPHRHLRLDDRVEIDLGDWQRILIVRELRDRPVAKAEAAKLYEDLSGPRPKLDAIDRAMRGAPVRREKGAGRPTKQERRAMEKFRERDG